MTTRRGRQPQKILKLLPPRPANGKCSHCGERPVEYNTDMHGMPTEHGTCRDCHERACYLNTRNAYDWG